MEERPQEYFSSQGKGSTDSVLGTLVFMRAEK
jgi:hypothetical protein